MKITAEMRGHVVRNGEWASARVVKVGQQWLTVQFEADDARETVRRIEFRPLTTGPLPYVTDSRSRRNGGRQFSTTFAASEWEQIERAARERNVSVSELLRVGLRSVGVLS